MAQHSATDAAMVAEIKGHISDIATWIVNVVGIAVAVLGLMVGAGWLIGTFTEDGRWLMGGLLVGLLSAGLLLASRVAPHTQTRITAQPLSFEDPRDI